MRHQVTKSRAAPDAGSQAPGGVAARATTGLSMVIQYSTWPPKWRKQSSA